MDLIPHHNNNDKKPRPRKHWKHHSASPHLIRFGSKRSSNDASHAKLKKRSDSLPPQFSREYPSEYRHVNSPQQLFTYVDNQIAHFAQFHNQSTSEMMRQYFPQHELEEYEMVKRQIEQNNKLSKSHKHKVVRSEIKQKQKPPSQMQTFINPPKREPCVDAAWTKFEIDVWPGAEEVIYQMAMIDLFMLEEESAKQGPSNKEVEDLDISMQFGGLTDEDLSMMYKRWINIRRKSLNSKQRKEICIFLKRIRFEIEARSAMLERATPEEPQQPLGPGEAGESKNKMPTIQNPSLQNPSFSSDIKQQNNDLEPPINKRLETVQTQRRSQRDKVICEIEVFV